MDVLLCAADDWLLDKDEMHYYQEHECKMDSKGLPSRQNFGKHPATEATFDSPPSRRLPRRGLSETMVLSKGKSRKTHKDMLKLLDRWLLK
jgi:hypothetical protein